MKKTSEDLQALVYGFLTKHEEGFTDEERTELLTNFPDINMKKYHEALGVHTVIVTEENETITFHEDMLVALRCGLENRDITFLEWD